MQYQPAMGVLATQPFVRWYVVDAVEGESFLTTQGEILMSSFQKTLDAPIMTVTEKSMSQTAVPAPKTLTWATTVPSGLARMEILYGSGSTGKGFVLVEASPANAPINTPDSMWLLRMNNGVGSWVNCGDLSAFGGNLMAGQEPSFARVGSLLYFTHSHTKIGCIDTAAASPSMTFPEKINTLLDKLYHGTPADTVGPLQSQLSSDGETLIIWYPDVNWNGVYYAVNASGTVLGSLRTDKTSVTSFDAKGKQGATLPLKDALNNVRLPSPDLFQANIF